MRIINKGKYLQVLPQNDDVRLDLLLGCRQRKNDPWYMVENNVINRLVLGIEPAVQTESSDATSLCTTAVLNTAESLDDYQIADVEKMCALTSVFNSNPMGLGKTVETICFLRSIGARSVLIVVPKIIRTQWAAKIEEWWGHEVEIYEKQKQITPGKVWIVNYDKLINETTQAKFKRFRWDVLVVDEAHNIKTRTSKRTLAVKAIPAARRVALTGTPILRYVDDLWSQLHFLDETYSGVSYWNFVHYFCRQQESPWGDKIVGMTTNPEKVGLLNQLLQLVAIRNDSVEVAHGKRVDRVLLPMERAQRDLYRKEKALLLDELPEGMTIPNGAVLTMRLRQTTSWPGLYLEGVAGPKFEWLLELCLNNPTEKIVVFSVFEKTVQGLAMYLRANKVRVATITGKQKDQENELNKRVFIERDAQVLIGTIGAMYQGYDGLQNASHTIVFIDREWSPEIMAQAEDRLHRRGQNNLVNVYYLECQASFDQHVGRINQNKADDIRRALQNE